VKSIIKYVQVGINFNLPIDNNQQIVYYMGKKMALTEPIRDPIQVQAFLAYYRSRGNARNQVLTTVALHTALHISGGDVKQKTKNKGKLDTKAEFTL